MKQNKATKLNVLLGKTDHLASAYRNMIKDFTKFFKNSQSSFRGERKTYEPKPGTIDQPGQRKVQKVVTTVDEKFDWFKENATEYLDALFSLEKTNASGVPKAELVVEGKNWGEFTTLELLRLKSLIENGEFATLLENIPVRSDSEIWSETSNEAYQGRKVYDSPLQAGVVKSTTKESYILVDPNISKLQDGSSYTPITAVRNTIVELGDYTHQRFSGEWSHRKRAEVLRRRQVLLTAIIEALKKANDCEAVQSDLTAEKVLGYLFE